MNLTELTTQFYNQTGRVDLSAVEVTNVLNQATELLDQLETSDGSYSRFYRILEAGEYIVTLPEKARWLQSVATIIGSTRTVLYRQDSSYVRSQLIASTTQGDPLFYCRLTTRLGVIDPAELLGFQLDMDAVILDQSTLKTALLVFPIPQQQTIIDIEGIFYTPALSAEVVTNKWSELYPHYIIQAAQYILMKDMLNMDESAKMLANLQATVMPLTHDTYSDEDINSMEG
jgi:hypothetical protein